VTLLVGSKLGPYEIVAPLGAGGMGEVYRAKDSRLGRDVAVKVLPASFSNDPDRLRRFEQEARAAGILNHPNITAVYDVGTVDGAPYVVTELLEGETLRSRLAGGPLAPRRAIEYSIQIVHGLAAAHEKGIVHRDLKPENLFVTKDGRVKILDFGLAKLTQPEKAGPQTSLPTETAGTEPGVVLGTLGYMSPEQVRGRLADARSDIFSFGAILYEMLSGKRAFHGDSAADTMSAILREDPPDLSATNRDVHPGLDRIVRHCLEKNPEERFQSASDLAFDLEALTGVSGPGTVAAAVLRRGRGRRLLLLAAAAVASAITLAVTFLLGQRTAQPEPASFHRVTWRHGTVLSARFAPDGQTVLYSASWDGQPPAIYLKRPESPDAVPLELPSAELLAMSPSGEMAIQLNRRFAHQGVSVGTLARAPLTGGAPREIAENVNQVDWGPDGRLVVARDVGGKGRLECPLGKVLYETTGHVSFPRFSPRGDLIAFIDHPLPTDDRGSIAVIDLSGRKRTLSKEWETVEGLAWSPSGGEVWFTAATGPGRSLYGMTLSGRQRVIARMAADLRLQDVTRSGRVLLTRDDQRLGIKCLAPGETKERELSWLEWSLLDDLSRDGKTIVFSEQGEAAGANYTVCLRKTDGSSVVRLGEGVPAGLSPDGKWIISRLPKPGAPIVLLPTGPGEPKELSNSGFTGGATWFPDGKRVLLVAREAGRGLTRLYVQSLDGGKPRPISPEGVAGRIVISPDGRLVAAVGPDRKIALYPVEGGEPRPVPGVAEGEVPLQWSADGRSLYIGKGREFFSAHVFRLDLETGKRVPWKELLPEDSAGVVAVINVRVTPDGRSYAYTYQRELSDLYVGEGLK
jgi:Tol biopolymer transport system component